MIMREQFIALLLCVTVCQTFGQNRPQRKDYAILFYITTFQDKGWPPLPETKREVMALAEELEEQYGFEVDIIPNPKKEDILSTIEQVNQRKYGPNDQVFFFFSTHGYYDKDTNQGYLIPYNGKIIDPYGRSYISYGELGTYITRNPSEHVLLGIDACYSGAFGKRFRGDPPTDPPWEQKGDCQTQIQSALKYNSRLYFTSGSYDQRTPAESLFAQGWLAALRKGHDTGLVRNNDLRYHLGRIEYPQPEYGNFSSKHQAGGDFVFVHKNACGNNPETDLYEKHWQSIGDPPNLDKVIDHLRLYPGSPYRNKALDILESERVDPGMKIPDNMVFIKGGTFEMGSKDGESNEKPVHQVTVSDYYLSRVETTVQEFSQFVENTGYKTDAEKNGGSYFWEGGEWKKKAGTDWRYDAKGDLRPTSEYDHPVIHVSWNDAIAYCNWLSETQNLKPVYTKTGDNVTADWNASGYRLPTEAEWEFAARSRGEDYKYAWGNGKPNGNIADETAKSSFSGWAIWNNYEDGYIYTSPVGSFEQGDLGLADMTGNVWEWCWDRVGNYPASAQINPRVLASGSKRVIRGGSWLNAPALLRCANRHDDSLGVGSDCVGFRLSKAVR